MLITDANIYQLIWTCVASCCDEPVSPNRLPLHSVPYLSLISKLVALLRFSKLFPDEGEVPDDRPSYYALSGCRRAEQTATAATGLCRDAHGLGIDVPGWRRWLSRWPAQCRIRHGSSGPSQFSAATRPKKEDKLVRGRDRKSTETPFVGYSIVR